MTPEQYIASARKLLVAQPSEVDVRRSISTAYYGMFHHVSQNLHAVFDPLSGARQPTGQWVGLYRCVDHKLLRDRCNEAKKSVWGFSVPLLTYADSFVSAYTSRIAADYDPSTIPKVSDATLLAAEIELAISDFHLAPVDQQRAFVLFVCLRPRTG